MRRWTGDQQGGDYSHLRGEMVAGQLERRGLHDEDVLAAMRTVPRERFVPPDLQGRAYADNALPISHGQTISQPYIVARMTEALRLSAWRRAHPEDRPRVLDVGTGSGYQAAILAAMGAHVVSVERDAELAAEARSRLRALGYVVEVIVADGSRGAPRFAPFAGIVVAAAAPAVPGPLVDQLALDGRLVLPVGGPAEQELVVVRREGERTVIEPIEAAVFVPLVGEHGFPER
ncbi:MAG TPA: protein-L-isoaspartate(D-aspartate) O-methyltransferase [Candidatus Caenarcaniphilales bacterium]|nr:protein-L-isoaspartate(D-aspartate) O-methyltransferase [Candidatus Caenarcaniphilales bacterium]